MKNSPPLAPDGLSRDVRISRHAAAVLLILPIIIAFIPFAAFFSSSIFNPLLCLIADFLLWRIASDAPTKTAALLFGAGNLLSIFVDLPQIGGVCMGISSLVAVYASSLLLRNRRLEASDRSWIGLLAVGQCFGIVFAFSRIWMGYFQASGLPWPHLWTVPIYYRIFQFGWGILSAIAVWRLAHCPLFAGRQAETEPLPAGFYSPLNRYMAALVIASAAAVGGLTLLYANATQIVG